MFLGDNYKFVPIYNYKDLSDHDTVMPSDSMNMKNYHHATIYMQFKSIGVASPLLYAYSGATDAALTSALTFYYAFGGAAAGSALCDVMAAWATSAALTVTHGTYDDYMLILEIDAASMDMANDEEWLTLNFTDPTTGCTGNVTAGAILHPRYKEQSIATCLT